MQFFRTSLVALMSAVAVQDAESAESCEKTAGHFVSLEGAVEVSHADKGNWLPARLESSLCEEDTVHVGPNSRAAVALINEAVLRLDQNTTLRLVDVAEKPEERSLLELVAGALKSFSRAPRTLTVHTPYVNGMIEGTEFAMRVEGDRTLVTVYEGKVNTANDKGRLSLARGESAVAQAGKAPQPYILVKPRDAVQWTLYFPPVLAALGGGTRQMPPDASPAVRNALGLAARGDTPGALALLEGVPDPERNARYHLYRAALFLNVGRVDEARADIDAALAKDPKAGLAYALRAVIEVVRNDRTQALSDAEKAVALSPSAAAKIALSYAQQAEFRIEAARDTSFIAAKEYPNDPLVQARLAELWLMFAEREKALDAARKAEALAPDLGRTQTVLGFAALAENQESDAKMAFERAIGLASADPLAHFGLGLAEIKRGKLAEGRGEIEAAVALDSSNALLRSYLGKSYYEEKRAPLDEQQYNIAKELDPADPTAYFYDAIAKQTTNRPVEALQDLQKSIELNDNRAVYRSKQLLDSDLAARSAGIGRIYSDLGYQALALRSGWQSVLTDPSNFSAHRLLSDSYALMPRHEIARVSELLQSQLLQPLNMTPIQPHLAESNLFLISAQGPAAQSFNEFNPIFNRDGFTVQANGLAGEHNTYAGEGIVSGIQKNTAFSVGGFHFSTDGFRQNAGQTEDIADAFVQFEPTSQASVQAEFRYRNSKRGDLQQRFFGDDFYPGLSDNTETFYGRLGGRYSFSQDSILLGSFIYSNRDETQIDKAPPFPGLNYISFKGPPTNAYTAEAQHLFRSSYLNLTSGVGYVNINGNFDTTLNVGMPPQTETISSNTGISGRHVNGYAYGYLNVLKDVTFTLGAGVDSLSGDSTFTGGENKININPKAGITWNLFSSTTFRVAGFRTTKRTLVTNQTLEPTQVAGFNQFFDDLNATESWVYGAAIDQKFTKEIFGGVEVFRRDLQIPYFDVTDPSITHKSNGQENWALGYLFWTPHPWLALRAEYLLERITNEVVFGEQPVELNTHRVPLAINFFHPSGLSTKLTTTYWNQSGNFQRFSTGEIQSGNTDFWTVDAAISYRLPKRYGLISIAVANLFDQKFRFYNPDFNNPFIQPDRTVLARVTLAFP